MRFHTADKKFRTAIFASLLAASMLLAGNGYAQRGEILQEFNPVTAERLDSLNSVSRQAAEKTLQDVALRKDENGNLVSTSWGPVTATNPYVSAPARNLENARQAYLNSRDADGDIPQRPYPPHLVNDFTGILSQSQVDALTIRCNEFANKTSNQVAIVILPRLWGKSPADVAYKIGKKWGVGQSKFDNGVVFLVKPKVGDEKGEVFIAVGDGLEPVLTDAFTKRIIELRIIPAFKENDYYNGINDALNIIFPVASGEVSTDEFAYNGEDSGAGFMGLLMFIFFIAIILIAFGSSNNKNNNFGSGNRRGEDFSAGYILGNILSSLARGGFGSTGHSGGWGGSSGGWGGGGFGGFGGGGFSGGGAGGSW